MAARTKEEWIRLFRRLGIANAEPWAECEINEDLGNLARLAFVRQALAALPDENWVDGSLQENGASQSAAGFVRAYDRVVGAGARKEDVVALVRAACRDYFWQVAYLLDDNSVEDEELKELVHWGLWEESENSEPLRRIGCISDGAHVVDPDFKDG